MRSHLKVLLITGSLVAASLGAAASATAATVPPSTVNTTNLACSNGVCEVGPGNVGMPFAMVLRGTGGPVPYNGPECNAYIMSVVSGSLPPGLQFGEPICEWTITGTPTKAGTYFFTVQVTPQPDGFGNPSGPSGTQQLSITVGTGSSDRLVITAAAYNGHQFRLYVDGYDPNITALYSVHVTSTGKVVIPPTSNSASLDGFLALTAHLNDPCGALNSCSLTVTDSLGSSVAVTLPPAKY